MYREIINKIPGDLPVTRFQRLICGQMFLIPSSQRGHESLGLRKQLVESWVYFKFSLGFS